LEQAARRGEAVRVQVWMQQRVWMRQCCRLLPGAGASAWEPVGAGRRGQNFLF